MAFFKFRLSRTDRSSAVADNDNSAENVEAVRRRARYRLIGSVVLVTTAVVGFPLLFDTQPRPVSMDTPIVIPSRQVVTGDSVVAAPQLPAQAGLDVKEEVIKDKSEPKVETPMEGVANKVVEKPLEKTTPQPVDKKPEIKQVENPPSKSSTQSSGERAQALLDGKTSDATEGKYLIQVGAFTDAAKVTEVRNKLERAGLKTYTQVTDTKDGKKLTRVRLGPYLGKDTVDKTAERIRKLGLKPAILKL